MQPEQRKKKRKRKTDEEEKRRSMSRGCMHDSGVEVHVCLCNPLRLLPAVGIYVSGRLNTDFQLAAVAVFTYTPSR
jgi:hypothetical protein